MKFVSSREELREAFSATHEVALKKECRSLDFHSCQFIRKSPFVLIGSQDKSGISFLNSTFY